MNETVETVAELDEAIAVDESGEVSQEDKALVLLEVVQAVVAAALDSGISPELKEIRIQFKDEGGVAVLAVDEAGVEVEKIISTEEIVDLLAL